MTKKRILCMFLSILLLFSYMIPAPTEVSAAKKKITGMHSDDIIVESGRQFYIGDMIFAQLDEKSFGPPLSLTTDEEIFTYSATEMGATYVSDCPEVLTIEEKSGYATTKEPGSATVMVNCQGAYAFFPVTVVAKGTFCAGKEQVIDKWESAGKKLAKKIPDKLTPENGYELFQALKTYLAAFTTSPLKDEYQGIGYVNWMLDGWDSSSGKYRMAPACSCYVRAYYMIKHYVAKYHPIHDKKYWTAKDGQYFTVSGTTDQITIKMKKKLTKQALLALYLNEFLNEVDGYGPDGAIPPPAISATVQKNRFEACSYIAKYTDTDERYRGHTVTVFKLGSKTATVTDVCLAKYNPTNARHKHIQKKKLQLKKGKKYYLRIDTMYFYWPGEFVVK